MATTTQQLAGIGWQAVIGIGVEATAGTAVSPTIYLNASDANPSVERTTAKRQPIRRTKGQAFPGPGITQVKGDVTTECNPTTIGSILGLSFGSDTVAASGLNYSHTFKLNSPLNTFTLAVDYFKGEVHQFAGCKMDSINISAKSKGGLLEVKAGIIGVQDTPVSGTLTPVYASPDRPFFFEDITSATINGVQLKATDFNFGMKNNIQPEWFTGSGQLPGQMNETETQVTGTMTVQYEDETIFDLLNNNTPTPISLQFTHPTAPYLVTINIPNAVLTSGPISVSKKNVMTHSVKFEAYESVAGGLDDMSIVLVNTTSTSYTA